MTLSLWKCHHKTLYFVQLIREERKKITCKKKEGRKRERGRIGGRERGRDKGREKQREESRFDNIQ